jgi:hypothetical protein
MDDVSGAGQPSQKPEISYRPRRTRGPRPPEADGSQVEVLSGERVGNHEDLDTTLAQTRAELGDVGPDAAGTPAEQHDDLHRVITCTAT